MTATDPTTTATPPTLYAVLSPGDDSITASSAGARALADALNVDEDDTYRAYRLVALPLGAVRAEAHGVPYASVTDLRRWADELETTMPPDDLDLLDLIADPSPEQERIAAVLADLDRIVVFCRDQHFHGCLCGALAARTIRTLTGEDT